MSTKVEIPRRDWRNTDLEGNVEHLTVVRLPLLNQEKKGRYSGYSKKLLRSPRSQLLRSPRTLSVLVRDPTLSVDRRHSVLPDTSSRDYLNNFSPIFYAPFQALPSLPLDPFLSSTTFL